MTHHRFSRRAVLGGMGALGAGALARPRSARAQAHPVRIGVLMDAAGFSADLGGPGSVAAARMAVQDFGGTVLGLPVEILHADTLNKADVAGAIARKWYDSGVDAIVDLPVTPVAAAVQQIAREKERTVMITAAALTDFTARTCSPFSTHWADDVHSLVKGTAGGLIGKGRKTWFFITVDYSFGKSLQSEATAAIEAAGGKVVGGSAFPLGSTDFSSQLLNAQASGADVIGLAAVGQDQVNLIKQAGEFGLLAGGKRTMAGFIVYLTDVHALGLNAAQGLVFTTGFDWAQSEQSRAFAKRFSAERKAMPTKNQAGVYAATLHFLRGVQQAGTRDALAVNKAMRSMPVENFGRPTTVREDGRVLYDLTLYRVKTPSESKAPWDYCQEIGTIGPGEAFLPVRPTCRMPA